MNRGDVWQLDLGRRAGRRPALILTRQGVIAHVSKITVAEITSIGKGYPTEVPIATTPTCPKNRMCSSTTSKPLPKIVS